MRVLLLLRSDQSRRFPSALCESEGRRTGQWSSSLLPREARTHAPRSCRTSSRGFTPPRPRLPERGIVSPSLANALLWSTSASPPARTARTALGFSDRGRMCGLLFLPGAPCPRVMRPGEWVRTRALARDATRPPLFVASLWRGRQLHCRLRSVVVEPHRGSGGARQGSRRKRSARKGVRAEAYLAAAAGNGGRPPAVHA